MLTKRVSSVVKELNDRAILRLQTPFLRTKLGKTVRRALPDTKGYSVFVYNEHSSFGLA